MAESVAQAGAGQKDGATGAGVGLVCNEIWGGNRGFHGPVELPGLRGALFSQPCAGRRGGDVHYLSVCGSGIIARACLADVAGHGAGVAAVSQEMHELLRRSVNHMDERRVLARLNRRLCALDNEAYTTALAMTYFPPTRRLTVSSAGHEPPWYFTAERGEWARLELPRRTGLADLPLAVDGATRYGRRVVRPAVGDRLLAVTDGVLEAADAGGGLFGHERVQQELSAGVALEPAAQVTALLDAVRRHRGGAALDHDDVSVLLVEFVDNLGGSALWTAVRNRLLRGWFRRPG